MFAEPQPISSVSIKFGRQHQHLDHVVDFQLTLGQNKTQAIRNHLTNTAKRQFQDNFAVYVSHFNGDISFIDEFVQKTNSQDIIVHKEGNTVFLIIPFNEAVASLEGYNPQGIEDKDSCLSGSFRVDKHTDIAQGMSLFANAHLQLNFRKTDTVSTVLQKLVHLISPADLDKVLSVYKLFKQFNLEINCSSSTGLPSEILQKVNSKFPQIFDWNQVNNLDKQGKAYYLFGKVGAVEFDINNKYFIRVIEMLMALSP